MLLTELLKKLDRQRFSAYASDIDITSICSDSKKASGGSLFVAIDGNKAKGSDFISEAIEKGAVCVIGSNTRMLTIPPKVPLIDFPDTRYALSVLADEFFGHPSGKLKVIGITGTNGKTTITYLIRSIAQQAGFPSGIIGTINYSFKDTIIPSSNTTPGPLELQPLLKQMAEHGCRYCVMEVSSHGLDQKRTEAIDFHAAIFTNLTQDHLDYHLNLENYFLAKSRLFTSLPDDSYALINVDCPFGQRLRHLTRGQVVTYAIDSDAMIKASGIKLDLSGSEFTLAMRHCKKKIKTQLIGKHNISNTLASIAFALTQGIEVPCIQKALESFSGVPGRLQRVTSGQRKIFVDYAHTPDALENVLHILRRLSKKRLTVVFGCGGERDALKRPLMGRIAERYADRVIITSDNPRSEEPEKIASDIVSGIHGKNYTIILDRREAIHDAIAKSGKEDTILLAGKGHENYQIFQDKKIVFDDIMVAEECVGVGERMKQP